MNLHSIVYTPTKEINNISFFDSYFMGLVKYSSFSDIIFILTESIIFSYKLLSFIRKYTEKNKDPSFKLFINFFLRFIPTFVIIFNIFFMFYYFNEVATFLSMKDDNYNRTKLKYFRNNILYCNSCMENIKNLIPFYMQYQYFFENS